MKSLPLWMVAVLAVLIYLAPHMRAQPTESAAPPAATSSPIITVPGTPPSVNPSVPSQTAVSVNQVQSPAAPTHFTDQAIWGVMVSMFMEWLKNKKWFTFLTPDSTARLKTQFGFVAALITAAGIHFSVTGNFLDGAAGGAVVTLSGLSLDAFKDVAWQWAAQQAAYKVFVKDDSPAVAPVTVVHG